MVCVGLQFFHAPGFVEDDFEGFHRGGSLGGRQGGGEDIGAAGVAQVVDHIFFACDVAAHGGDGLAEGAHLDIDDVAETEVFFNTATGFAEYADRVGFVHHQPGVVFPAKFDHFGQVDNIAIHTEDGIGDDELGDVRRCLLEAFFFHVVMFEAAEHGAGHKTTVDDAGVVEFVGEYPVAAPHEGGDDAQVGGVAGCIGDGGFGMFEIGDGFFEFDVQIEGAGEGADAVGAGTVFIDGSFGGGCNSGMTEQAQISVRGVHPHFTSINDHARVTTQLGDGHVVEITFACFQISDTVDHGLNTL